MIGTPCNLELLLHCYYSPEPHDRLWAPAIKEGVEYLLREGMISATEQVGRYKTTDKAEAFIKHLMAVPFPQAKWIVPSRQNVAGACA